MADISRYCECEKYDKEKEYECDILIRNSLYWHIPENIKAKKIYEILHADYEWLEHVMKINQWEKAEKIGCGEYVAKQYEKVHPDKAPVKWIRNILAPKVRTKKVLRLITCSRLAPEKGWNRMLQMISMLRRVNIPFTWDIFTNTKIDPATIPEEVHLWSSKYKGIFDYLANADYLVQLSDTEGLPYSVQEALQYGTACIVTDIGGMTELIKDGVNGYVVPLDMNFDINKIVNVPVFEEYKGTDVKEWLDLLGGAEYIKKERKIIMVEVKALKKFRDMSINKDRQVGEVFEVDKTRAEYLSNERELVEIIREVKEPVIEEAVKEVKKETANKKKTNAKK